MSVLNESGATFAGTSKQSNDLAIYVATPDMSVSELRTQPEGQRNEPALCRLAGGGFVAVWSYDGQAVGNPLGIEGALLAVADDERREVFALERAVLRARKLVRRVDDAHEPPGVVGREELGERVLAPRVAELVASAPRGLGALFSATELRRVLRAARAGEINALEAGAREAT